MEMIVKYKDQEYTVLMHRFIMGLWKREPEIDHNNRNGLDNRKENLVLCTHSDNMHRCIMVDTSSCIM